MIAEWMFDHLHEIDDGNDEDFFATGASLTYEETMQIVTEQVDLPQTCYLCEMLFWLAFKRLPRSIFWDDGDLRFSTQLGFATEEILEPIGTNADCRAAGLSSNPALSEENLYASGPNFTVLPIPTEDKWFGTLEEKDRYDAALQDWARKFDAHVQYYKSRILVDLIERNISCFGLPLPPISMSEVEEYFLAKNVNVNLTSFSEPIQADFWRQAHIDWHNSFVNSSEAAYCWVGIDMETMLARYPVPSDGSAVRATQVGDLFVLTSEVDVELGTRSALRGRPPLDWGAFHVEVAALVAADSLPEKKEAAIEHFIDWFRNQLGVSASRSAIGVS